MVINALDENYEYQTAIEYIQNQCESYVEGQCGMSVCQTNQQQTTALGVRESKAKIDTLEKEIFMLKLQLTHYRNERPTQVDEKRIISLQIQNELQRNELATNRTVIMKAAKLLQSMENQFATDATDSAHAKEMALEEMKSHCTASQQSPFDHGDFGDQWTMQNQQQLYRFHFNELSAQIHQLKRQLHATQTELLEQLEISRDLSEQINETIIHNNYLQMKFDANEKLVANYMNRIKRWIKLNLKMIDEINSLRNRSRNSSVKSGNGGDGRSQSRHSQTATMDEINRTLMTQTEPVAALNWKWPVDCNERFDETTAKSTDTKGVDYGHAITNVTPLEMIRIGCATAPMTSPRSSMEHHRLIFAEQFGQTLTRFMQYQSIFMSSSPTFKTVVYEQLRATVEAVIDRWNSCSSAMMPLIERNQNEPYYRKRKSITVRNLFVPLMYIYLFR